MKFKNTLILLVVAAGLFAFIRYYEGKHGTTREREWTGSHLAIFDADAIDAMTVTNTRDKIELRFKDNTWRLASPVNDRANLDLVHRIITTLQDLEVIDSFDPSGKASGVPSLKDMGLETPVVRVKLSGKGAPPDILFGKDTAVEGQTYAMVEGSPRVCVVSSALKDDLQKSSDDFRDHRLIAFSPQSVNRLDVKSPAGEIEVLRDRAGWSVSKPLNARSDVRNIIRLVSQAVNTPVLAFLPENGANLATYGLAEPRGSITIGAEGNDTPAVLQIGQPLEDDKRKVYAKLSTRESILVLPENINDILFLRPNDVRDKQLLELNLDMVDRIHIEAVGKPELTIGRKGEDWILKSYGDLPANNNLVNAFVTYLRALKVTGFVSDVATDLPKYGLDKPQLRITFSSYASGNTAESTAGEDTILSVALGASEGNAVYARLESEPYVVSIPRLMPDGHTIFEAISPDPVYWEDLSIYDFQPEEITSLAITRGGATTALERSGNTWKLKSGPAALNQVAIESLVNTLAQLHAARSAGSSTTGLGFDKPSLVIAFTTSGKKTGRLTIGSQDDYGMWNAMAGGRAGAFQISGPDYQALQANLSPVASPAPSPSPAAAPSGAPAGVK